ncbi:hypothetical protein [Undibacterium terreum]|uniref:Uncharacterized protein n=1 Tax=Undibacterium terreum TaxID=1224302 RepID=A0A916XSB7_9BURK|nr:hypothetical protein [Undibacterium terreum]GGD00646.1 hypothetical protein GCM10011396_55270 [Undibacterium terreum]
MERKYFFEKGNWDEASWVLAKQFPERFPTECESRNHLKNAVLEVLDMLALTEIKRFDPIINGSIMALPSPSLQRSYMGDYESVHVHFWQCLSTDDYSVIEVLPTWGPYAGATSDARAPKAETHGDTDVRFIHNIIRRS